MNSTVENDKPQLKTKTRNGTRKRGNLPDSISSTAEIFNHLIKRFIFIKRESLSHHLKSRLMTYS